jgi:hypothetical protein
VMQYVLAREERAEYSIEEGTSASA